MEDLEFLRRRRKEEQRRRKEKERRQRDGSETPTTQQPTTENCGSHLDPHHGSRKRPRTDQRQDTYPPMGQIGTIFNASPVTSSVSSVSNAMSPHKHRSNNERPREDEDFVAIARRLEEERRRRWALEATNVATLQDEDDEQLPPLNRLSEVPKRSIQTTELTETEARECDEDEAEEDDEFIKHTKRLARLQETRSRPHVGNQVAVNDPGWDDGHSSEDGGDFGRRVAKSLKRQVEAENGSTESPRSRLIGIENAARKHKGSSGDEDSLFDTDDEELEIRKRLSSAKKRPARPSSDRKKRARPKSPDNKSRRHQKHKPESPASSTPDPGQSDSCSDDENDPEYGLRPQKRGASLEELRSLQPLVMEYGEDEDNPLTNEVPAPINRFLKDYQQDGIRFLHTCITERRGAILGDDMGLGKTIQVLGLLSALLKKTGTRADARELKRRTKQILERQKELEEANNKALLEGQPIVPMSSVSTEGLSLPMWAPVLIIVPASVLPTWEAQFERWGYFGVASYQAQARSIALHSVRLGHNEILLSGNPLFCREDGFREMCSVSWKLIIVDEYHQCKNVKSVFYNHLRALKAACKCQILGLTGTLMQNDHQELWNLVDLVEPGLLGPWSVFNNEVAAPIKYGRSKTAGDEVIQKSNVVTHILDHRMGTMYLSRKKHDVLSDELPLKEQRVVFCPLEPIQKLLYEHIINLPEYRLLRFMFAPCDCGVNRAIFASYKKLRSDRERIDFLHSHHKTIVQRKDCCYQTPLSEDNYEIDARAVIWKDQHTDGKQCSRCPHCLLFPALAILWKVCSHAALLQARGNPSSFEEGSTEWNAASKELRFAEVALPDHIRRLLPGEACVRRDSIMDDHSSLSGKMRVLDKLLKRFDATGDRVLIFSTSTSTLSLIENFTRSKGYSYLRLDGQVATKDRQALINRYQQDESVFLFLISTKAGGLGLNLTAANVVVIFDTSYNPSHDEQAEDRAFRIGQKKDVRVYRLVSQGTVEELTYIRQIYKVQLKQETLKATEEGQSARIFNGVAGDPTRRGELFGTVNLLKFKDGSFMDDMWKAAENGGAQKSKSGINEQNAADMQGALEQMSKRAIANIEERVHQADFENVANSAPRFDDDVEKNANTGVNDHDFDGHHVVNHQDFFNAARGDAAMKPGDDGFDGEMGGESQMACHVLENAAVDEDGNRVSFKGHALAREGETDARVLVKQEPCPSDYSAFHVAPTNQPEQNSEVVAMEESGMESVDAYSEESTQPLDEEDLQADELNRSLNGRPRTTEPIDNTVSRQVGVGSPTTMDEGSASCKATRSSPKVAPANDNSASYSAIPLRTAARRAGNKPKARRRMPLPTPPQDIDTTTLFDLPSYTYGDSKEKK